jgi:(p)ppGpp synthase/HD superfamily hydrolase
MLEKLRLPSDVFENAIEIAIECHHGQRSKDGTPYILHPMRVMHKVAQHENDVVSCAAILHDVVEDTSMTLEGLAMYMPIEVCAIVDLVSRRPEQTYEEFIERLAPCPEARVVKMADLNDNLWHPARRRGWRDNKTKSLKERYLKAWFYLKDFS